MPNDHDGDEDEAEETTTGGLEMTGRNKQDSGDVVEFFQEEQESAVANNVLQEEQSRLIHLLSDAPRDLSAANATLRNFGLMCVLFSAVPACALACLALATARLGSIGAWQSGILYLTYTACAVLGATLVVKRLGSRNAMMLGMTLYCVYVACFWLAAWKPAEARPLALTGAALGGIGAGFLWTAQGVYFSQAAEEYSLESGVDWPKSNGMLAGIFAFVLLAEETAMDVLSSVLIRVFGVPWTIIFALYSAIAISATLGMNLVKKYPNNDPETASLSTVFSKATACLQLLVRDPKMKYMIGFNAAFGFAGAFLNSFISGEVVPVALQDSNSSYVGLLVAIHGIVAALFSLIFAQMSERIGKGPVLIVGALCFAFVAFPFLVQPDLERWNWGLLIVVYSLEGMGRATFEGTLKATFADYFSYEKEGAFANIILQNGLSSAVAYVLSFRLTCSQPSTYCIQYQDGSLHNLFVFASLVVGISILAIVGYWRAAYLFDQAWAWTSCLATVNDRLTSTVPRDERRRES